MLMIREQEEQNQHDEQLVLRVEEMCEDGDWKA